MTLWAMLCRATQDRWVMVESFDKMWSTGEANGKPLQYSCLENPMNSKKRKKDMTQRWTPQVGRCPYATGDQWRNHTRKSEEMEPKEKQHTVVDVTGDESKAWCCKEQYCIETWNVRSMNQGKLEVVKRNGKSERRHSRKQWKWTGMGEFNSDDHYIYYYVQESLRKKKKSSHHSQQQSPKCSTWMQSQKRQNYLYSFPRQTIQYHGQFSSVVQSCPTLCDPMNCSTPGLPVHHHLPEFTQTHVHRVCDAIQPSHPGSSPW